ncbi:hypothetical protein [Nostoc sp. CMAA1605]|uniref:hypothetical protein n=1 Tax=Nostoc sp. CMAA1605 TaxID=2055159 RepID=UPI001F32DAD1|nr:hypothetical protein [Nostoc sp. CMAA1605]MCF4966084.1 hypothetical protein [Nostoc sp. CMAA1605]
MTLKLTRESSFHSPLHPYTLTPLHPYTPTPLHPYTLTPLHPYTPTPLHPKTKVFGTQRKKPTPVRDWGFF